MFHKILLTKKIIIIILATSIPTTSRKEESLNFSVMWAHKLKDAGHRILTTKSFLELQKGTKVLLPEDGQWTSAPHNSFWLIEYSTKCAKRLYELHTRSLQSQHRQRVQAFGELREKPLLIMHHPNIWYHTKTKCTLFFCVSYSFFLPNLRHVVLLAQKRTWLHINSLQCKCWMQGTLSLRKKVC